MRLIPPRIGDDVGEGERLVFEALAQADGRGADGWTVLHSLDIASHSRQVEGEIDFLLVVPRMGVLVLEVKGAHRLRRADGLWYFGADTQGDPRGPFKQASRGMHSVRDRLVKGRPQLRGVPFWSAVVFPFIDFTVSSDEWHPWQVVDRRALAARPLTEHVLHALERGRSRLAERGAAWFRPQDGEPSGAQCAEIVRLLRPEFEFYESPKSRARRVDEELRHYTEEQFEALDAMERNPRVVFDGPAGTGKTLLAIEAARRGRAAGRRVLFLCFNRPLRVWLADQLADLAPTGPEGHADGDAHGEMPGADGAGPGVTVRTLHEQMHHVAGLGFGDHQRDDAFWQTELPERAADGLLEELERGVTRHGVHPPHVYDELVLDEAQDVLRQSYLDFLDLSLTGGLREGRWRIFGDFVYQCVYDASSLTLEEFVAGAGYPVWSLATNCRNTPRVAAMACTCAGIVDGYGRVLRADDGMEPEIDGYRDQGEQTELLVRELQRLHDEGFEGGGVAVLSMRADEHSAAVRITAQPWVDRLQPIVHSGRHMSAGAAAESIELHSGHVHYGSVKRFKGLEARAVVITDVEELSDEACSLLYVGVTRALQRLVILAERDVARRLRSRVGAAR